MAESSRTCYHCGFGLTGITVVPPSPVEELLHSNSIPSSSQEQAINNVLSAVESDISRLDGEIARISSVMKQLQTERQSLQTYVDEHKALLTPARRLFPELWAEIFLRCSKGSVRKRLPTVLDSFDAKRGPLLLTHVCRSWRRTALSTPELWTLIRIPVNGRFRQPQLDLTRLWLERSGACPLTIAMSERITGSERISPPIESWMTNPAVLVLIEHSHRWENAYFMLPPLHELWGLFSPIRGNLPLLRNLLINVSYGSYSSDDHTFTNVFESAPQLKTLTLDYGIPLSLLKVPHRQITYLRMLMHRETPPSVNMCLKAISLLPNLQECFLQCGGVEPWNGPVTEVHNKNLHKLTVILEPMKETNLERGLPSLFNQLTLPSLRSLLVEAHYPNSRGWHHDSFGHFLSRSPGIEHLTFLVPQLSGSELIETLRETPNLSSLYLRIRPRAIPFTEILSELLLGDLRTSHGAPLLLNLRNIEIDADNAALSILFVDKIDVLYQRTVLADLYQIQRLESVVIYCRDPANRYLELSSEVEQEMIKLAREGLSIRIYNDFASRSDMTVKSSSADLIFTSEHFSQQGAESGI